MRTDDAGQPAPACRVVGHGRNHISGSLTTAAQTAIEEHLGHCAGTVDVLTASKTVLICPIPQYVVGKCNQDCQHFLNFDSSVNEEELTEFWEQHRQLLVWWAAAVGLNFEVIDPTAVDSPTEPLLRG
jgi:hypothetical protein